MESLIILCHRLNPASHLAVLIKGECQAFTGQRRWITWYSIIDYEICLWRVALCSQAACGSRVCVLPPSLSPPSPPPHVPLLYLLVSTNVSVTVSSVIAVTLLPLLLPSHLCRAITIKQEWTSLLLCNNYSCDSAQGENDLIVSG